MKKYSLKENIHGKKGFALFYVLLIVGTVLVATSVFLDFALDEMIISADREESEMAWYMSEAGIECAIYYGNRPFRAFHMRSEENTYYCRTDAGPVSFKAGWQEGSYEAGNTLNYEDDQCYWDDDRILITGLMSPGDYDHDSEKYRVFGEKEPIIIRSEASDACARVTVVVESRKRGSPGEEMVRCAVTIRSVGASKCDADGYPAEGAVERIRIQTM